MADNHPAAPLYLQGLLDEAVAASSSSDTNNQPAYLHKLATTIAYNLEHQHEWTNIDIHTVSPVTGQPLARPLVSGLPPKRAYVHPDEQAEIVKIEHATKSKVPQNPELEWVLPTHLGESWSLRQFAETFDSITTVPPTASEAPVDDPSIAGYQFRGNNRKKRLLLATLHDDSTVVYYIVHDGLMKPRQN